MTTAELASRLEDILEAIAAIGEYTAGKTFEDYAAERMLRDAVERNIERISEASRHIPDSLRASHPDIEWPKVASIGNILRHAYPIVDDDVIWQVVIRDLPPLHAAARSMLREVEAEDRSDSGATSSG